MQEFNEAKQVLSSTYNLTIQSLMISFFEKQIPFSITIRVDDSWESILPKDVIIYDKLDGSQARSGTLRFQIKDISLTNSYVRSKVLYLYTKLENAEGLLELKIKLSDIDILFFGMDMHPKMRLINPVAVNTLELTHKERLDLIINSYSYFKSINHYMVKNKSLESLIYERDNSEGMDI